MNDYRSCECVNRFLKNATPVEILGYIRSRIKGSNIQSCPFLRGEDMENAERELKEKYNKLIKRWNDYETFVSNKNIEMSEKVKWVARAQKLTNDMTTILNTMEGEDITYTEHEILNGFENLEEAVT